MSGIMPAMLTINGSVPFTGIDIRLPMRRPGYITGTLRRPSCTKTMATMVPSVTTTSTTSKASRVCSSARIWPKLAGRRLGELLEELDLADGVQRRHRHRQDEGPPFHPLARLSGILLAHPLKRWDDRNQQLQDDLGGDVRVDPHGQDREVRHRAAGEQVEQVEQRVLAKEPEQRLAVDVRHRPGGREPVE